MNEPSGLGLLVFLWLWHGRESAQEQYQRQQLNLLRAHQGLPPEPPAYRPVFLLLFRLGLFVVLAFITGWLGTGAGYVVWALGAPAWAYWLTGIAGMFVIGLILGELWRAGCDALYRRGYERHIERWHEAGCP